MTDYTDLIKDLMSNDSDRKRKACKRAATAIRELANARDEATCLLAQARVQADGQRSRAEKAEAELTVAQAALREFPAVYAVKRNIVEWHEKHYAAIAAARAEGGE